MILVKRVGEDEFTTEKFGNFVFCTNAQRSCKNVIMLKIRKFVVNPLQENSLVVYDESNECIIIDAGFYYGEEEDEVCHFIEKNELKPVRLINTHCHFDHLMGVEFLRKKIRFETGGS